MKSAIEEHALAPLVYHWWAIAGTDILKWQAAINWFHGAGSVHHDETTSMELHFLSHVLYEKGMLP